MSEQYKKPLTTFAVMLLVFELLVLFMYGFFVRVDTSITSDHLNSYYPWFQDVNVMMLIGFGYLMTFLKNYGWGALGFTFFINALVVQYYVLWEGFWHKVFHNGFGELFVSIDSKLLISCSFAVAAVLISYGAVIGRVGPLELLIMALIEIIGYSFNEALIYGGGITVFDVGGSMAIHAFGAYFGLTVSTIIGKKKPLTTSTPSTNYRSCIFAMIGTLFLWLFWPSFNSGTMSNDSLYEYQRTLAIINTVLALTGSCLSAFAFSIILRGEFSMDDILNATLAGGVIVGSSASLITNPAGAIAIGIIGGFVSTFGFCKLSEKLTSWGIYDTCGIHNLHALPGLLGGLASAVFISAYNVSPLNIGTAKVDFSGVNYLYQGGLQVAGTFISVGMGIATGIVAGLVLLTIYNVHSEDFFKDECFWEVHAEHPGPTLDSGSKHIKAI